MKRLGLVALLAVVAVAMLSPAAYAAGKGTVKIYNKSKWDIHHFYISPNDDEHWGPDQLGKDVLEAGGSFKLTDVECDLYDVKLVDEDGDECVVTEVELCNDDQLWTITDDDLLSCEGWK